MISTPRSSTTARKSSSSASAPMRIPTQANWAHDSGFPNLFASDPDQTVAKLYGSADGKFDTRNVFVVGPDGQISSRIMKFNVLSGDAYTELGTDVAATLKTAGPSH